MVVSFEMRMSLTSYHQLIIDSQPGSPPAVAARNKFEVQSRAEFHYNYVRGHYP